MGDLPKSINELSVDSDEPDNSKPQAYELIHESDTTRIFCGGDLGVKVLIDSNLNVEQRLGILEHEHKVSKSLPSSYPKRKVSRVEMDNGVAAMYFDWVDGVTVHEWLRSDEETQQLPGELDCTSLTLNGRLHVAIAITKSVCEFHEVGMIHGQLNLDNVVLDFNEGINSCSAVLIDYSQSVITTDSSFSVLDEQQRKEFMDVKKQKDLNDLGVVIYSVLSNHIPKSTQQGEDNTDEDVKGKRSKRGKRQQVQEISNLPLYLVSLVSSLLTPNAIQGGNVQYVYNSSRDVLSDLQLAAENPTDYLKIHHWADLATKPLIFPQGAFYGRKTELLMVQHAFDAMMEGGSKPCALVVSGYAGAGKSTLLEQITKPLEQSSGYRIACKFNQSDSPDTILSSGFDAFFEQILERGSEEVKTSIRARIEECLGERVAALEESMPHLRVLLGRYGFVNRGDGISQALTLRWKFLLSSLVSAISSKSHPIALVLEDLHWADDDAIDTIHLIAIDTRTRYCIYCMSYRDINVNVEPKLNNLKDGLQSQGVALWNIKLGSIEKESVDCLVSQTLCMPPAAIEELSCVVRKKTGGVILFVTNFLRSLYEERLIYFNLTTLRYEYDISKIQAKEVSSDIIDFLSERIMRLPRSIQTGLKVAACLGSTFDSAVFQKANKTLEVNTHDFISFAVENGFIQELPSNQFKWSHDQLQAAAYSLIPFNKRELTHLLIGARIYLNSSPEEAQSMIHDIVHTNTSIEIGFIDMLAAIGNMNLGISQLDSQERKTELAQLNLAAGEESKRTSAFYSAANYFMTGIDLLDKNWQNTSYELAMKLFNSATEMLIVTGHINRFESTLRQPLHHARTFEDRLPAYHTSIRFLCISGRFEEALHTCFTILGESGEEFSSEVTAEVVEEEILQTEPLLNSFPKHDMQSLSRVTDPTRYNIMKTMSTATLILFSTKPELAYMIGCRMIKRSIEHGWCSDSAFGLYAFGQGLISQTKKVDEGCLWVKVGLALLEEFNDRARLPVLETLYHEFISFWKEPIQMTSESLIRTHKESLLEGQMEFSMSSAFHSCRHSFMCGTNLTKLKNDCQKVTDKMVQLKQMWSIMFHSSLHSLVLKLMGDTNQNQAFGVFGDAINNEDDLLNGGLTSGKQTLVQYIYLYRSINAFWLGNYDDAARFAELYGRDHMRFLDIYHVFYEGLTALRLARMENGDKTKWVSIGETAVSTFETWKDHNTWNFENKFLLLSAELHHTKGDHCSAEEYYKSAIESARNHRFVHEEGLALESLGMLYKGLGRADYANEMLTSAGLCYEKWGATAVITRLHSQM